MPTNYESGVYAERLAMAELRADGYTVVRTAGSHGPVDVIAWDEWLVLLIQIKRGEKRPPKREYNKLAEMVTPYRDPVVVSVELWYYKPGSTKPEKWRCA